MKREYTCKWEKVKDGDQTLTKDNCKEVVDLKTEIYAPPTSMYISIISYVQDGQERTYVADFLGLIIMGCQVHIGHITIQPSMPKKYT